MVTKLVLPNNDSLKAEFGKTINPALRQIAAVPEIAIQLDQNIGIGKDEVGIHGSSFIAKPELPITNISELRKALLKVLFKTVRTLGFELPSNGVLPRAENLTVSPFANLRLGSGYGYTANCAKQSDSFLVNCVRALTATEGRSGSALVILATVKLFTARCASAVRGLVNQLGFSHTGITAPVVRVFTQQSAVAVDRLSTNATSSVWSGMQKLEVPVVAISSTGSELPCSKALWCFVHGNSADLTGGVGFNHLDLQDKDIVRPAMRVAETGRNVLSLDSLSKRSTRCKLSTATNVWDAYLKYQVVKPEAFEIWITAGSAREKGNVYN